MIEKLRGMRKAIAAGLGSILTMLVFVNGIFFIPSSMRETIGVLLAILTPIATYIFPNEKQVTTT